MELALASPTQLAQHLQWKAARQRLSPTPTPSPRPAPPKVIQSIPEKPAKLVWIDRRVVVRDFSIKNGVVLTELNDTPEHPPERITVAEIQGAVCRVAQITRAEMISPRRVGHFVLPRHIGMALSVKFSNRSLPDIGRRFKRDHTTVLHARDKMQPIIDSIEPLMKDDATILEWAAAMFEACNEVKFPKQTRVNGRFGPKIQIEAAP